jgi:SAM-dependent methyltransferase
MKSGFARQYGNLERWHWWFRGRRKIIEFVLGRQLPAAAQRSVVSVGCGPAEGLDWLVPFAGKHGQVVGLDIDPLHARPRPAGVEFVVGSVESIPLATASFDVVLALDVLEHLKDDDAGLRETLRLVKPGGLLLVTVPALPSLWGQQDIVNEHRRRYTRRTVTLLFAGAGLSGFWVSYFNTFLFPVVASVRLARRAMRLPHEARSDFEGGRPGFLNDALALLFGGERHLIKHAPMPIGVSLIVVYKNSGARPIQ